MFMVTTAESRGILVVRQKRAFSADTKIDLYRLVQIDNFRELMRYLETVCSPNRDIYMVFDCLIRQFGSYIAVQVSHPSVGGHLEYTFPSRCLRTCALFQAITYNSLVP